MRILFDQLLVKETNLPTNYLDGLKRVCYEDKYAFMILENMATLLQYQLDCKLEPLDVISHTTIAMVLQPNSPYRGIINSKCVRASLRWIKMIKYYSAKNLRFICCRILSLKDSGILQRMLITQRSTQKSIVSAHVNFANYSTGRLIRLSLITGNIIVGLGRDQRCNTAGAFRIRRIVHQHPHLRHGVHYL